jgi:hypothetical protein
MIITISSPKFGDHDIIINEEQLINVNKYKWYLVKSKTSDTYYARTNTRINGKRSYLLLHRYLTDCPKGKEVDHINGNGLDNRKENIRICSRSQNVCNAKKYKTGFTSKYKGVCFRKPSNKYVAQIMIGKIRKGLGYFEKEIDAAIAYNNAAIKYYGEFARVNSI